MDTKNRKDQELTPAPINLFWTGGWDSTFRLLQLIIIYQKKVQPYYIIDNNRKSVQNELLAMENIKRLLFEKFPEATSLLLPTEFEHLSNLMPDKKIMEAYLRLKKNNKLGAQYEWLARFCNQQDISDMELSHEKSVDPIENIRFKKVFGEIDFIENDIGNYMVSSKSNNSSVLLLFENIKIVLYDITKPEMVEISKKEGFFEIMCQTWFCHVPTTKNKPCGKCVPCRSAFFEKMGWRFPFASRIKYIFWKAIRKTGITKSK